MSQQVGALARSSRGRKRMTNSDTPQQDAPGVSRRRFLQYTGLGAAAAATVGIGAEAAAAGTTVSGKTVAGTAARGLPRGWSGSIADRKHRVILVQEHRS